VSADHARTQRRLQSYRELESEIDDLEALEEMAAEDDSIAERARRAAQLGPVQARRARRAAALLRPRTTRATPWCPFTRAPVAPTRRTGRRCCFEWRRAGPERRGFDVELAEVSPGEEAGIKSATFIARGENAYGLFSAEKGVHRLVRISPFDAQSRRHTSFALLEVSPLVDEVTDVRHRRRGPSDRHLPARRAPAAST